MFFQHRSNWLTLFGFVFFRHWSTWLNEFGLGFFWHWSPRLAVFPLHIITILVTICSIFYSILSCKKEIEVLEERNPSATPRLNSGRYILCNFDDIANLFLDGIRFQGTNGRKMGSAIDLTNLPRLNLGITLLLSWVQTFTTKQVSMIWWNAIQQIAVHTSTLQYRCLHQF